MNFLLDSFFYKHFNQVIKVMAKDNGIKCPETEPLAEGDELNCTESQVDSYNSGGGLALKSGVKYLIVPQLNTGRKYTVNGEERPSKRVWAVEMDGTKVIELRTIGISALRGMHVGDFVKGGEVPKFPVKVNDQTHLLRAQDAEYFHALDDVSFIRGNKDLMRAEVIRPVMISTPGRSKVYVLEYDPKDDGTPGGNVKTQDINGEEWAVPAVNRRFYKFNMEATPSQAQVNAALNALKDVKGFYPRPESEE